MKKDNSDYSEWTKEGQDGSTETIAIVGRDGGDSDAWNYNYERNLFKRVKQEKQICSMFYEILLY